MEIAAGGVAGITAGAVMEIAAGGVTAAGDAVVGRGGDMIGWRRISGRVGEPVIQPLSRKIVCLWARISGPKDTRSSACPRPVPGLRDMDMAGRPRRPQKN